MKSTVWHLITGEYPPQRGGVGDYTEQLAGALAASGLDVHVWCGGSDTPGVPVPGRVAERVGWGTGTPGVPDPRVTLHRLADGFRSSGLRELERGMDGTAEGRTLLVQYVPNALGMRGMNLPFCFWLRRRSRADDVRVVFHEPYFYFTWQRPARNLLAVVQRLMAIVLLEASHVTYVSTPTWERYLDPYMWFGRRPLVWLPIPATVPQVEAAAEVARIRLKLLLPGCTQIVGHFGTYAETLRPGVASVLERLLMARPDLVALCLGLNSDRFVAAMSDAHPVVRGRLLAGGFMSPEELSMHLQACDLLVQPYPDGLTVRRTSAIGVLANGVPMATTRGALTEPMWTEDAAVALAPAGDPAALVELAARLLGNDDRRRALGERGRRFCVDHLSLPRAIEILTDRHEAAIANRGGLQSV